MKRSCIQNAAGPTSMVLTATSLLPHPSFFSDSCAYNVVTTWSFIPPHLVDVIWKKVKQYVSSWRWPFIRAPAQDKSSSPDIWLLNWPEASWLWYLALSRSHSVGLSFRFLSLSLHLCLGRLWSISRIQLGFLKRVVSCMLQGVLNDRQHCFSVAKNAEPNIIKWSQHAILGLGTTASIPSPFLASDIVSKTGKDSKKRVTSPGGDIQSSLKYQLLPSLPGPNMLDNTSKYLENTSHKKK